MLQVTRLIKLASTDSRRDCCSFQQSIAIGLAHERASAFQSLINDGHRLLKTTDHRLFYDLFVSKRLTVASRIKGLHDAIGIMDRCKRNEFHSRKRDLTSLPVCFCSGLPTRHVDNQRWSIVSAHTEKDF